MKIGECWEGSLSIAPNNKEILFTPLREKGAKVPQRIPIDRAEDNLEHWKKLIQCSRESDKNTWSPMDLAFRTQTVLQMAMMGAREKRTIIYDPEKMSIS